MSIASICVKNHLFCLQDHERAYFDSADWALGKVFALCTLYDFAIVEVYTYIILV